MLIFYSLTLFLSAVLLFTIEPMVGKMLLPRCGGTPAVWNTCMVFFQMVLLLGYGYAHVSTLWLGVRRQAAFHLFVILLPLLVLPAIFSPENNPPPEANPSFWLLVQLTVVVGLPFFVITTTAPLLQKWFADTNHPAANDPYFLYSTSNAGSLLALLAYPFLIEPNIGLVLQTHVWHAGYALLAAMVFGCAILLWRASHSKGPATDIDAQPQANSLEPEPAENLTFSRRMKWILLAFVPSSLMLGATTHIATDIASVPLLWVIPLSLYLLTFILVFARKQIIPHSLMVTAMAFAVLLLPLLILSGHPRFWVVVPIHLAAFFIITMVCHGEMARTRPSSRHLTEFYFLMSLGGVLGGLFNSLFAPWIFSSVAIFNSVVEYPLMIVTACFLMPGREEDKKRKIFDHFDYGWLIGLIVVTGTSVGLSALVENWKWTSPTMIQINKYLGIGVLYIAPAIMCFSSKGRPARFALSVALLFLLADYQSRGNLENVLLVDRNFFGVNRVRVVVDQHGKKQFHQLVNGNTIHGMQKRYPKSSIEPTGYYCRSGPLGDVFEARWEPPDTQVAVIGLGSGGMAAYMQPWQKFTFFEIDPAVVAIAKDQKLFTFLADCHGESEIILGDARIQLANQPDHKFDIILMDAFSSDSIPMHLLTKEAFDLYLKKLKNDGMLVVQISNRYLRLNPVLGRVAQEYGLVCLNREDFTNSPWERQEFGKQASEFVVLARKERDLGWLVENPQWKPIETPPDTRIWTDDYSDILSVLRW